MDIVFLFKFRLFSHIHLGNNFFTNIINKIHHYHGNNYIVKVSKCSDMVRCIIIVLHTDFTDDMT